MKNYTKQQLIEMAKQSLENGAWRRALGYLQRADLMFEPTNYTLN
jgi:hypothetical protein